MNKLSKYALVLAACTVVLSCSNSKTVKGDYGIVPLPQDVTLSGESPFVLSSATPIIYPAANEQMARNAGYLSSFVNEATGYELKTGTGSAPKAITLALESTIQNPEGYQLTVSADGIRIAGASEAGVFYGIQTLRKAIPAQAGGARVELPAATINDYPRFAYRGMMLDVSRHFFPADSIKKYIDILALHNINTFHWHLSDDQGWRIEIKKYPELTQIGSKRSETVIGHNSGTYDGQEYGGFYTQDEIRDVVKYAQDRYITIIPEIDMPGHQQAALTTYPELGCTGGPYEVWKQWGVSEEVICAGNEQAMLFLEEVLTEVIELFPSKLIHVGGDECPKVRWTTCPKCRARIQAEGIKGDKKHTAEEYLQSYVISRMEKLVESKGRHIIGWDEILEGGLAPNATVMSWRGMAGGTEAAKQKHNVVMAPNTFVYFDYYQSTDTENDPIAIGGYLPLEKVYSFEPVPQDLTPEEQQYIIGAQANLWTEYIPTFSQVEFMVLPRMDALAETQWTDPSKKDYQHFLPRVVRMTEIYDRLGYNYAKHLFDVNATLTPNTENGSLEVSLLKLGEGSIHYTLDGSTPTSSSATYELPVQIKENADFKAVVIRPNGTASRLFSEQIHFNKATMKPITLKEEPNREYVYNGAPALADGLLGNANYKTGRWLGFYEKDADAVIDLKEPTEFRKVFIQTNVVKSDWIMGASAVTVRVSDDGQTFRQVATQPIAAMKETDPDGIYPQEISFEPVKARYVEVLVCRSKLPAWHGGAGRDAFLFIDEIGIE